MTIFKHLFTFCALNVLVTLGVGCSPTYVKNTEIDYTPEKQEVADVIERYRIALEKRDVDTLKAIAGDGYYENGSTTNDPSDDYDFQGLKKIIDAIGRQVKAVKYSIMIKEINVIQNEASVDVELQGQYLFTHKERDRWATYADKNRLTLRKLKGNWKIVSGL